MASSTTGRAIDVTWPQLPQREIWRQQGDHGDNGEYNMNMDGAVGESSGNRREGFLIKSVSDIIGMKVPDSQPGECEYLDHTADVQLHAWGSSRATAYAAAVVGLHEYMIDAPNTEATHCTTFEARGHDEPSLLYAVLDEALFLFASEGFVIKRARIDDKDFDSDFESVKVQVWGYYFVHGVHPQGTEVKAITYSNMQLIAKPDAMHLYVIVDI